MRIFVIFLASLGTLLLEIIRHSSSVSWYVTVEIQLPNKERVYFLIWTGLCPNRIIQNLPYMQLIASPRSLSLLIPIFPSAQPPKFLIFVIFHLKLPFFLSSFLPTPPFYSFLSLPRRSPKNNVYNYLASMKRSKNSSEGCLPSCRLSFPFETNFPTKF